MRLVARRALALLAAMGVWSAHANDACDPAGDPAGTTRWWIYHDSGSALNHGYWANRIPEQADKMMEVNLDSTDGPACGSTAIRIAVRFRPPGWVAVAVASEPNFWGLRAPSESYDLSRARKLVFRARGQTGGEALQIQSGILGGKPYGDSAASPASTDWIVLTQSWKEYQLDLKEYDLHRVVTPFVVVTNEANNGRPSVTFFLDEIYFLVQP